MNPDIEKIKAAYREWSISDGARFVLPGQEFFAGYKAALEAYAPDANNKRIENPEATPEWYPAIDPITGDELFMVIEHPTKGYVPTYGGPFDSYTLAERDESESDKDHIAFTRERYDHDLGGWIENEIELTGQVLISEDTYNAYDPDAIRLECAEAVGKLKNLCVIHFPTLYDEGLYDGYENAIAAIMSAGKETCRKSECEDFNCEACPASKQIDPDAIRRECAGAARKWHDLVYPGDRPIQDTLIKAIMSAGKE